MYVDTVHISVLLNSTHRAFFFFPRNTKGNKTSKEEAKINSSERSSFDVRKEKKKKAGDKEALQVFLLIL